MKLHVSSPTHNTLTLRPLAPGETYKDIQSGTDVSLAEGMFGKVILQNMTAGPYGVLYAFFNIREKCVLQFEGDAPALRLVVVLKGRGRLRVEGIGELTLEQGQFNIMYASRVNARVIFEQTADLLTFNLYFPLSLFQEFRPLFPLHPFIDRINGGDAALLFNRPGWISTEIIKEISYLLNAPAEPALREYFFTMKVKGLLHLLLLQKHYSGEDPISEAVLESIREARHIIESTVGEEFSVEKVARLARMNVHELKKYFKLVAGVSVPDFVASSRLHNAKLLLQESDLSIREIARISGYDHEQNFIQAFRKKFDYTPHALRSRRLL